MRTFFAVVLSAIAVGVLLIAYGLLGPRAVAARLPADGFAAAYTPYGVAASPVGSAVPRPIPVGEVVQIGDQLVYRSTAPDHVTVAPPVRTVTTRQAPRRTVTRVESPRRDWRKSALVIGGSAAAGAGLGAIFGGKQGALIGAAIGGGGGTIFEVAKR